MKTIDTNTIRQDFPILQRQVHNKPLTYFDNAATTQKPRCVIDAIKDEYLNVNANVHRGVHYLSIQATELHENARVKVQQFINAGSPSEIVFTRGTTESINLVAASYGEKYMKEGDEVILTVMEHHSNIVPWHLLRQRKGVKLRFADINEKGEIDLKNLESLFTTKTKMLSVCHVSNVLGTINPIGEIIQLAHRHGVPVLIDAAQSIPHHQIDVKQLDCDFLVFSSHKMYGPTGVGVLYGKKDWLEQMPPYQGGGEMIEHVSLDNVFYEKPPLKFEAGTPDYIATHGLGIAIDYLNSIGLDSIEQHEQTLRVYAEERLCGISGLRMFGTGTKKDAVFSFLVDNIHHLDMGTLLDQLGIAVRTGHHCAEPLMQRLGVSGVVRASLAFYNTAEEIDRLAEGIQRIRRMF